MAETPTGSSSSARAGSRAPKTRRKRTRGQKVGRFFGVLAIVVAVCLVGGVAALGVGYARTTIPDPNKDFTTNTTFVYYDDGKTELSSLAIQNRQSISYAQMPASIKQAVVAAENRTFWTDPGISIPGMARAALNIAKGGSLQGGSTITQQYIKIFYLKENQTITRKINEVFLAAKLGRTVPKQDILQDYLNTIYFGHGAYGIQAAAKAYFDVDAAKLTVPQSAFLASVINNPSLFDPDDRTNLPRLLDRYRYVLQGMKETGNITAAQEARYAKALPKFPTVKTPERYGGSKGFLLKAVENELGTIGMDQAQVNGGGYKIITTFDKKSQDAAVEAAQRYTKVAAGNASKKTSSLHAAIASVDVGTGAVRAMYGGPDYVTNSRNWATTPRPAASTFKVFGLAAGLENGFSLRSYFNGDTFESEGAPIRNEDSHQYGRVNLLRATADSINTAFTDLVRQVPDGPTKVMKEAADAGAPKISGANGWRDIDRVVIGDAEESPLNQATAYATYANGGMHVDTHVIKEIDDRNGKVIYQADPDQNRAVSKDVAADITYALSGVVREGTGTAVSGLGRPVAGKTGTQGVGDEIHSSWFVGYTKQVATAVMYVAGDAGNSNLDPYRKPGNTAFYGGTYPALTWSDYMKTATQGQDVGKFPTPAYVNTDKPYVPSQQTQGPVQTQAPQPSSGSQPTRSSAPQPSDTQSASSQPSGGSTSSQPPSEPATSAPATSAPATNAPATSAPATQSSRPTSQPTRTATSQPTRTATSQPTRTATSQSTRTATSQPTRQPSSRPTRTATSRPSSGQSNADQSNAGRSNAGRSNAGANAGSDSGG